MKFVCHDSKAVMACAKFHCDSFDLIWIIYNLYCALCSLNETHPLCVILLRWAILRMSWHSYLNICMCIRQWRFDSSWPCGISPTHGRARVVREMFLLGVQGSFPVRYARKYAELMPEKLIVGKWLLLWSVKGIVWSVMVICYCHICHLCTQLHALTLDREGRFW